MVEKLPHYIRLIYKDKDIRIFVATLLFYGVVSFSVSTLTMAAIVCIYLMAMFAITKNIYATLFLGFLACLPFENGKTYSMLLLPKKLVKSNIPANVVTYISFRVSDVLLMFLLYLVTARRMSELQVRHMAKILFAFLFLFIILLISTFFAMHPDASFVSFVQLFKLILIFSIPLYYWTYIKKTIYQIICASLVFQGSWGVLQYLNGGRLGKYIETIPNAYGIGKFAWENPGLLRVSGTFADPDLYGTFLLMQLGIVLGMVVYGLVKKRSNVWCITVLSIVFGILGVAFTGNRILYIFSAVLFFWFFRSIHIRELLKKIWRTRYSILGFLLFVLIVPYVLIRIGSLTSLFSPTGTGTFRIQMILGSIVLGTEHLMGVGLGMSPLYFANVFYWAKPIFNADYPHNLFMQMLAETGIVGLIASLVFVYLFFRAYLIGKARVSGKPFYLSVLLFFAASMFYPLVFDSIEIISLAFLYIGIAIAVNFSAQKI